MATTVEAAFELFRQNLEITGLQSETVSTRQKGVRDAVARELTVLKDFLVGSYMRSTMIAPLGEADVDVFVVLDPSYYKSTGHAALLDKVRGVLLKTYPKTPAISRNGQAVTITFSDFRVDVVPAVDRQGGGYLIPDSIRKTWISTDPTVHISELTAANKSHNGDLVRVIKMLKWWNKRHSSLLQSFHLEVMAWSCLNGIRIHDLPSGCRWCFEELEPMIDVIVPDPAGYGGDVGAYLDTVEKRDAVKARLRTAAAKAREAEADQYRGDERCAIKKWGVIFPDKFPAYG
ncbi:MAG: CBASS oligonucleotide cyclase [Bryobacteraceae bacterium]|nr:nucleotidyltransferase [bacterium]